MALRVMQVYLPESANGDLDEILEGKDVLGRWRDEDASQVVVHLLVPAEEIEPIMDRLEERFSSSDGFHVVLFPVEAVLPRPKPKEEEEKQEDNGEKNEEDEKQQKQERISREELYNEVTDGLGVTMIFLAMTVLSAVVAALGLMRDDVAVIIGAMVIAPLLAPNVALALGTTLGDYSLIRRALMTNIAGIGTAFVFAVLVGLIFQIDPEVPAIASRTNVGLGDLLLALAAGAAGTLAFTRGLAGAVIGVMVAVALMPPLVVCGMLLGEGEFWLSGNAFLLTVSNVICVNLAGVGTFLLVGIRPRSWFEAARAKRATIRAVIAWVILLAILVVVLLFSEGKDETEKSKPESEPSQSQQAPSSSEPTNTETSG